MTRELARQSPDYRFFTNAFRSTQLPDGIPQDRIDSFRFPNILLNGLSVVFRRPKLSHLVKNCNGFFFPNMNFFALPNDVPYVVTVHDMSFFHFPSFYSLKRRLWHAMIRARRIVERAAGVLAVSAATSVDCQRTFGIPSDRIAVVHLGITEHAHAPQDVRRVAERYRLTRPYLMSLGTLEPRKNLRVLLEAFTLLRETYHYDGDLVLCGGRGWSMGPFWHAIRNHPHRSAIRVMHYVPEGDKGGLYAGSDVFVYPSVYEGFGFPPLEALSCGTPVIAGHHSSLSEVLNDDATLIDVNNSREIAVAADAIIRTRPAIDGGVIRARYTWARAGEQTHGALQHFFSSYAHRH